MTDDSQLHHTPQEPGPSSSPRIKHPTPLFQQAIDPGTQGRFQPEELKLSMPPALLLDSSMNTGSNADTHPSIDVHASTDHWSDHSSIVPTCSIHSSLSNHPYINTVTGAMHCNVAAQRDEAHAVPPPVALQPYSKCLWSGTLTWVYDAQQLASRSGAVGQAAALEAPTCPLRQVETKD